MTSPIASGYWNKSRILIQCTTLIFCGKENQQKNKNQANDFVFIITLVITEVQKIKRNIDRKIKRKEVHKTYF